MDKALTFSSRQDWRVWLNSNHNKATSVWVVFYKKGSGKQTLTLQDAVEEAICFGWIDSKLQKRNDKTFILRFSPRKPYSVWSKINKERAEQLIASGQMSPAGLATVKEAKKNGAWDKAYTNITLDAVPTDLKEALLKSQRRGTTLTGSPTVTAICM